MYERVLREIETIRSKYPVVQHGEHLEWVLIPDYPLPAGRYERDQTRLLFMIPPGYPNTAPDSFFVDIDLKLKGGGPPPHSIQERTPAPVRLRWGPTGPGSPGTRNRGGPRLRLRAETT